MTCIQCDKFNKCKDENSITRYYLEDIARNDVEDVCGDFCRTENPMNKVFKEKAKMLDKQIVNSDSVLSNKEGTDFAISCDCGCKNTIRIEKNIYDEVGISFLTDNYYNKQQTIWSIIKEKFEKIKCILTNKDYYYFEIILTKDQFNEFREYIDRLDDKEN